nr:Gag-Pol polyprotein [Tanacetum cinerariifolium]
MSTQQDIYAAGSKSRPPMLNKENYVPWSSRLLRYAKSRPNGKLIHNSILNGPYVKRMIPEPGDANCKVTVTETFHVQIDDELPEKELKQIEADDQAIQTILLGLPEDIYAAVDSCETAQEIWLRVQQMMKGSDIGIQEKKAKLFNEWERNKHFPEKIASNLKFLNNLQPEWSRHVTIVHQTKDLHTADYTQLYDFLKYNQKERISSNPRNMQIAQLGMNMGQDRQMQMVGGNGRNQFRKYVGQNAANLTRYNDIIGNQIRNGNLVAVRAEGNDFFKGTIDSTQFIRRFHDDILVAKVKFQNFTMTPEENKDAYKVFAERSMNEFLKVYGNVKEYYESFDSRYSNMLLEQWYLVEVFICGLPWELGNNVRVYKPNSLSIAYCLTLLEEISYNFTKNISMKLNESNEEEKDSDGLLVLNDDCKETKSRVSGIDGDNELLVNVTVEIVKESFEGENRLVDDVRCDEAELKVSKMDDNNNSKEVEKESVESVGYKECCEENIEGLGIETKESVDNNECLKKIVKFVNGMI